MISDIREGGSPEELCEKKKREVDSWFASGQKIAHDAFNELADIGFWDDPEIIADRPLSRHYEVRYRQMRPGQADYIMQKSDPQEVARFDALIDMANEVLNRWSRGDTTAVNDWQKLKKQVVV